MRDQLDKSMKSREPTKVPVGHVRPRTGGGDDPTDGSRFEAAYRWYDYGGSDITVTNDHVVHGALELEGFIFQWDQGLAPATYRATLLDSASHATESLVLSNFLVPQADARNCDIAVLTSVYPASSDLQI